MSLSDNAGEGASPFATPKAIEDPMADFFRPPRLGIIHLLAWTAAFAVFLKLNLALRMLDPGGGRVVDNPVYQGFSALFAGMNGAALTGLGTLLLARRRHPEGSLQPGHWILIVSTCATLAHWAVYLGIRVLLRSAMDRSNLAMLVSCSLTAAVSTLAAGGYWWAAARSRPCVGWRSFLRFLATIQSLYSAVSIGEVALVVLQGWGMIGMLIGLQTVFSVLVLFALSLTMIVDALRYRRDWIHWLGVVVLDGGHAVSLAFWVWFRFFFRPS
jgi:hypothetical protein